MPTLGCAASGDGGWFGFFVNESEGYNYKACGVAEVEVSEL